MIHISGLNSRLIHVTKQTVTKSARWKQAAASLVCDILPSRERIRSNGLIAYCAVSAAGAEGGETGKVLHASLEGTLSNELSAEVTFQQ